MWSNKTSDEYTMEIKRMYVPTAHRGQGIASKILCLLMDWANELGYNRCVLETGEDMLPAITLYKKHGFIQIPNYGQYVDVKNSVCFEKYI